MRPSLEPRPTDRRGHAPYRSAHIVTWLRAGLFGVLLSLLASLPASAADHLRLPRHLCEPSTVFEGDFEPAAAVQSSAGSGGASGLVQRDVAIAGLGTRRYYLSVPPPGVAPRPLLIALHGAAGAGLADAAAQSVRDLWSPLAQDRGLIVMAPVASGSQGGWVPALDFAQIDALIADAESAYPIDRARVYLWGFSAGGHVAHGLALSRDPTRYAAYAVNAGVLDGYAGSSAPALAPRRTPLSVRIGSSDALLGFALADQQRFIDAGWARGLDLQFVSFTGGHTLSAADPPAHWALLCRFALLP